jgi:hypothetical protein
MPAYTKKDQYYEEKIESIKKDTEKTMQLMGRIENITYLGFLIIIFMVTALIFGYIELVYSGSKNDDYKYNLSTQVNDTQNQMKILKNCLNVSGWLNPKCLEQ